MTAPDGEIPDGSLEVGDFEAWRARTEEYAKNAMKAPLLDSFEGVEFEMDEQVKGPLDTAVVNAGVALTEAQAAINAAANAGQKADVAYDAATEWALEWSAASAEVTLGAGEVLVGPMLAVRDGRDALLTDIYIALLEQHDGLTVETRLWNADNTAYRAVHTAVIGAGETRRKWTALEIDVADEERFWTNVNDIVGTVPPTVLQIHVSGVYVDEEEESS